MVLSFVINLVLFQALIADSLVFLEKLEGKIKYYLQVLNSEHLSSITSHPSTNCATNSLRNRIHKHSEWGGGGRQKKHPFFPQLTTKYSEVTVVTETVVIDHKEESPCLNTNNFVIN